MNALFARASLKRSPRTRTRKASISITSETGCPPSRSSFTMTGSCGGPLPLHIIPELSEIDFEFDSESPLPFDLSIPQSHKPFRPSPRVTLSAFQFSIDDALLMLNDEPRSPTLSASSSTEGSNFSEELPCTPGASDDEDFYELRLPTPRLRPHHIDIRPLCITKSRSIAEDENVADIIEKDTDSHPHNALVELPDAQENREKDEDEHDFYTRQFQDFISLYSPGMQVVAAPARRESIILSLEDAPKSCVEQPKPRGRSRFSKALPRLPFPMPPSSTLPMVPPVPASVPTASTREKRAIPPLPTYPPPPPPAERRPPPRMSVPSDIGDLDFFEEEPLPLAAQIWFDDDEEEEEEESIYSRPLSPLPRDSALSATSMDEIYLPRASTDSDAPRSSIDSFSSCNSASSSSDSAPISPFSFPSTPIEKSHQLRSRWSSSTLGSLNVETPRTATILSPLRNVFGSKTRRPRPLLLMSPPPITQVPSHTHAHSKMPLTRMLFPATPSPPSTPKPSRHIRRQNSRSSTNSSAWSECESCESGNSSSGLRRKPIPVEMFLRA